MWKKGYYLRQTELAWIYKNKIALPSEILKKKKKVEETEEAKINWYHLMHICVCVNKSITNMKCVWSITVFQWIYGQTVKRERWSAYAQRK